MAYEVTATRRRPKQFKDLIGQEFVAETLKNSMAQERIAHAYLFSGPRGVGKTSAARILAKAINCLQRNNNEPCGVCESCREIQKGTSLDVIEIDGASNTGINDIREIKDEVLFAPSHLKYKVYIIDEVHMLSNSAFNALLKTIEEPPPYIVFIFATTEIHKVPATIKSRCQQFNFRLIPLHKVEECVKSTVSEMDLQIDSESLFWIAKESTGSLRDAYTLFDQVASFCGKEILIDKIREKLGLVGIDMIAEFCGKIISGNSEAALQDLHGFLQKGIAVEQLTVDLIDYFRALLFIKSGIKKSSLVGLHLEKMDLSYLNLVSKEQIDFGFEKLLKLYKDIRYTVNARFELESVISSLCHIKEYISPALIYKRIRDLKKDLFSAERSEEPAKAKVKAEYVAKQESEEKSDNADVIAKQADGNGNSEPLEKSITHHNYDKMAKSEPLSESALKEELTNRLRKQKIALVSAIEKCTDFNWDGSQLVIVFKDGFNANFLKEELMTLKTVLREIAGKAVDVLIEVREESSENKESQVEVEEKDDENIDLVKKIFRGEIIGDKE